MSTLRCGFFPWIYLLNRREYKHLHLPSHKSCPSSRNLDGKGYTKDLLQQFSDNFLGVPFMFLPYFLWCYYIYRISIGNFIYACVIAVSLDCSHGLRTGIFEASKLLVINIAPTLPNMQVRHIKIAFLVVLIFHFSCHKTVFLLDDNHNLWIHTKVV